jgi:hypothetical protein
MNSSHQKPILSSTSSILPLDGAWSVSRWPFAGDEASLAAPGTDDAAWEQIPQPGKVFYADPEAEGGEIPNWNRVTLEHIDPDDGAILRREVGVPSDWAGQRILLRFEAVYPAGRFYINGNFLGEHLSGLTPVEFDVTGLVTPGRTALVAIRLLRRHKFIQLDMPRHALEFAGLAQSACLFAVPPCHIADHHMVSELDAGLTSATVSGTVTIADPIPGSTVTVAVGDVAKTVAVVDGQAEVSLSLENPRLWNDEYPHLYPVDITLHAPGQADQAVSYRTGFRRLELNPDGPRLNGNPVKFRGVNHLTFHPEHGLHTPEDWLRRNLTLMKRANVNAIRTHFLSPVCLADLCDELGIYLLQELPIDWGTDYIHDPEWLSPALLRIESGVRRDRHHPSVMVWSVGNENMPNTPEHAEAGWGHLRQFDVLIKQLDPTRPTMFPPPGPANAIDGILELRVGDIADTHYSFRHIKRFLDEGAVQNPNSWKADMVTHTREWALERGWSGCWFSSEYGIFNALPDLLYHPHCSIINDVPEDALSGKSSLQAFEERLRREWGFMRHDPTCLGGAYFPWLCSGAGSSEAGNPWGWVRWGEDADWGVVTADLLPKPFFWALRVLFSPVWFPQRLAWEPGMASLSFPVWNQYNAIDLKDCTLRVQQNVASRYGSMMRKFRDIPMACPPGKKAEIAIPLDDPLLKGLEKGTPALVRCTLLAPDRFRPITAEIVVVPKSLNITEADAPMNLGPDAIIG